MGKLLFMTAGLVAATVILSGCSHVQTTEKFNGLELTAVPKAKTVTHINSQMYGIYLFNCVPMFCGSSAGVGKTSVFKDTVSVDNTMMMMTTAARNAGCNRVTDVSSRVDSNWIPFGLVLWKREVQVSGNGIK
jgi:hypothetical protein